MSEIFATVAKAFQDGGLGMYPILVSLTFAIAIVIERIHVLYFKAALDKDAFLQGFKKHLFAGDLDKAISYCAGQKRTPLVSVIKAGLVNVPKSDEDVQAAMDEATLRESPRLERRTGGGLHHLPHAADRSAQVEQEQAHRP